MANSHLSLLPSESHPSPHPPTGAQPISIYVKLHSLTSWELLVALMRLFPPLPHPPPLPLSPLPLTGTSSIQQGASAHCLKKPENKNTLNYFYFKGDYLF